MNWKRLAAEIEADEGRVRHAYKDTVGVITIGVGRNLEGVGLFDDEIDYLFHNDLRRAYHSCRYHLDVFPFLSEERQLVLVNMCFNLGTTRLLGFEKMLAALAKHDYQEAAAQMLDSKWATQVGERAQRLAARMRGVGVT
jgi:lysozyme